MSHNPADLYLSLHDDGPVVAAVSPVRRVAALVLAVLLLCAAPLLWLNADAVAATGPKATISHDGDDDNSGPTATNSNTATNRDNTGVSTKQATATASKSATNTGKTGVSTKKPTKTASKSATKTGKTGVSTKQPT